MTSATTQMLTPRDVQAQQSIGAIAVQIVVFTTALSLFSLPWIITFGCRWIGLKPLLP